MDNPNANIPYLAPAPERQGMDIPTFIQNYSQMARNTELVKANKAADNRKAWNDYFDPEKISPKKIYDHNAKAVDAAVSRFNELQAQGAAAGYDIDNNRMPTEFKNELTKARNDLNQVVTMGEENQQLFEMYQKEFVGNKDKYNVQDWYKFNDDFDKIDPNDTVAQNKFLKSNNPLKEDIHYVDVLKKWAGLPDTIETGDLTVTELSPEKTRERITTNFLDVSPDQQDAMLEEARTIAKETTGKDLPTATDVIDFMTNQVLAMGEKKVSRDEPRQSSSASSGSGSGSGSKSAKTVLTSQYRDNGGLQRGVNKNVLRVVREGTQDDLPPVEVTITEGGESSQVNFQPTEFVLGKDGKIGVFGKKTSKDEFGDAVTENIWVDYETNKALFDGQAGQDIQKYFDTENGKAGATKSDNSSSSYEIKGKTYSEADLLGMGYTKEQIAKYKK